MSIWRVSCLCIPDLKMALSSSILCVFLFWKKFPYKPSDSPVIFFIFFSPYIFFSLFLVKPFPLFLLLIQCTGWLRCGVHPFGTWLSHREILSARKAPPVLPFCWFNKHVHKTLRIAQISLVIFRLIFLFHLILYGTDCILCSSNSSLLWSPHCKWGCLIKWNISLYGFIFMRKPPPPPLTYQPVLPNMNHLLVPSSLSKLCEPSHLSRRKRPTENCQMPPAKSSSLTQLVIAQLASD